ncbi:TPA: GNAT family N-acetyltransferase, partial [Burkholderia cepacia]|nr:GNAT family N-acetyltransferase [Burkholderia cepacia]
MLDLINSLADGFVAVPVIDACRRRELFRILEARPSGLTINELVKATGANEGHLRVAVRLLVELGWMTQTRDDECVLLPMAHVVCQIPDNARELIQLVMQDVFREPSGQTLCAWLERAASGWDGADAQVSGLLDGALLAPLLVDIHRLGGAVVLEGEAQLAMSGTCQTALRRYFETRGWAGADSSRFRLNGAGQYLVSSGAALSVAVSYQTMLARIETLLFGEAGSVFERGATGHERHLDRPLNVTGSGAQHQIYFEAFEVLMVDLFDRDPLETQPRYIADMGCGDGSLLRRVYEAVLTRTRRGQHLARYPLHLIGVDFNEQALETAARTLEGTPHFLVTGDIGDPEGLIATLQSNGIPDPEHILHIRSFLDHDRNGRVPTLDAAVADKRRLPLSGVYVDRQGASIEPAAALQSLVEHLARWKAVVSRYGLAVLEVHCLNPGAVRQHGVRTGALHFDAYHAFSGQHLFEAQVFLMAAAEAGLFPERAAAQCFPRGAPFTRITLNRFVARRYRLRHPLERDVPRLRELELACWSAGLAVPESELRRRIDVFPQGQFVLEQDGQIVAALYSQRVTALDQLRCLPFAEFARIHDPAGAVGHLLGICVAPDHQGQGLADELIDFVLVYLACCEGIETVAGVTRCHDYDPHQPSAVPMDEYIRLRDPAGQPVEPMLRFHESHGATLHEVVTGFRPEDAANDGAGVLIEYAQFRLAIEPKESPPPVAHVAMSGALIGIVQEVVVQVLGKARAQVYGPRIPLMEMGLSSLELLELRHRLGERIGQTLEATFFFQYGTPSAIIDYLQTQDLKIDEPMRGAIFPASEGEEKRELNPGAPKPGHEVKQAAANPEGIAIIGVGCRFPGGAVNPERFWEVLRDGRDTIGTRMTAEAGRLGGAAPERLGGFLTDIDWFDAAFFRISPREAEFIDPQQRLLLEVVWEALEQAGIAPGQLAGSRTGVFVGVMGHDYELLLRHQLGDHDADPHFATGNAASIAAGRIAYYFDWHGPTLTVDTACSSSLVATHLACESLRSGECDVAIAGGVNLLLDDRTFVAFSRAGMLAPDGRCKTFDAAANGYGRGEGGGVLILKRLADAERDHDSIWAVIRGSAINQDGASAGLTAPNQTAQQAVIDAAVRRSGIFPHEVRYLEAHGTGTSLGDPIEIQAAAAALGRGRNPDQPLWVGSVKTNVGHLEAAAGIAGLIKILLSMRYGVIPKHLHVTTLNPQVDWSKLPVRVAREARPWPAGRKVAGVSSFGFSGTNAHVVLEEYGVESEDSPIEVAEERPVLVVLSARSEERLKAQVEQLQTYLDVHEVNLTELAYTLQMGRDAMAVRLALEVTSLEELAGKLGQFVAGNEAIEHLWHGKVRQHRDDLFSLFAHDEEAGRTIGQAISQWIARGKLNKLAKLWVQGLEVEWSQLYGESKPKRISLPTYPFAKERYWVPEGSEQKPTRAGISQAQLHPLVHRNSSTLDEQRYSTMLTGDEWFVRDHVLVGQPVVPGVVQLEWARAAVALASGLPADQVVVLQDVTWLRPLTVSAPLEVHIGLMMEDDGRVGYEIYSNQADGSGGDEAVVYSQGWAQVDAGDEAPRIDLAGLRALCERTVPGAECYARFAQLGLVCGPSLRVLNVLQVGDGLAIGALRRPIAQDGYGLPPALLDGALQASVGVATEDAGLGLPFAVQEVKQWG